MRKGHGLVLDVRQTHWQHTEFAASNVAIAEEMLR
jgi:hypothetical protein